MSTWSPRAAYFQHLKTLVDLEVLKRSGLKVVVDVLYGTGRDYLDTFLSEAGVEVELLNGYRDAYFGGHRPEPSEEFLQDLSARVRATGAHLGLAVDADADRFGVMDAGGVYRDANTVLGLLFDYLIETRGWDGGVARSVATTHLLDRIAARYNRPVYVTKVGFKYLGEYINNDQVVMVGEESEGFSMKHHLPEKDGILAGVFGGRNGGPDRQGPPGTHCRPVCQGGAGLQPPPQFLPDAGSQRAAAGAPSDRAGPVRRSGRGRAHHPGRAQVRPCRRQLGVFPPLRHRAGGALLFRGLVAG